MSSEPHSDTEALALEANGISYHYNDKPALNQVSLELPRGSFTALLGPNGAGKTTLFSLITRLLRSRQGTIKICGHNIATAPELALDQLGIVFQQPTLDPGLTVNQNMHYFSALRGLSRAEAADRIAEEIERLEIGDITSKRVSSLNGGHRRRVEIARALLHKPRLLLLDEPTVGLDVPTRRQFVDYAHALTAERDVAVLWATHLIDEVDVDNDALVVLHQGAVVASGDTESVINRAGADSLLGAYEALTPRSVS